MFSLIRVIKSVGLGANRDPIGPNVYTSDVYTGDFDVFVAFAIYTPDGAVDRLFGLK
ncbi:MAG: hypothetical protein AAFW95_03585 [Cyanobacteria bacterium J06638_6]